MTVEFARAEWSRAVDALRDSQPLLANSRFDGTASRAYYGAFHAVAALFALDDRMFVKHSALEAGVHRDLVKAGRWTVALGRDFSFCAELRGVGDYGTNVRVNAQQASNSFESAKRIMLAVRDALPADFASMTA